MISDLDAVPLPLTNILATVGKSATEAARAEAAFRLMEAAKAANLPVTDELKSRVDALAGAYAAAKVKLDEAEAAQRRAQEQSRFLGQAMTDAVSDLLVEGRSLGDVFDGLAKSIAKAALQAALLGSGPLGGLFGMGGSAGATGGIIGALFKGLGFADGGYVSGPGTSHSDSIPARLSDGEFVMNAEATAKNRRLLELLNAGRVPHFADGGAVGSARPIPMPAMGATGMRSGNVITLAPSITVNAAGGTAEENADLARQTAKATEQLMRVVVRQELATQMRPRGMLNH